MPQWTYFEKTANDPSADGLVIIDTINFSESEWIDLQCVEDVQDAAIAIAKRRNATIITLKFD